MILKIHFVNFKRYDPCSENYYYHLWNIYDVSRNPDVDFAGKSKRGFEESRKYEFHKLCGDNHSYDTGCGAYIICRLFKISLAV